MRIGSIEGSGNYFLGQQDAQRGWQQLEHTVSGVIQDRSFFGEGGTGGSLTKVGTGTLTGTNPYTGMTTVNAGNLIAEWNDHCYGHEIVPESTARFG